MILVCLPPSWPCDDRGGPVARCPTCWWWLTVWVLHQTWQLLLSETPRIHSSSESPDPALIFLVLARWHHQLSALSWWARADCRDVVYQKAGKLWSNILSHAWSLDDLMMIEEWLIIFKYKPLINFINFIDDMDSMTDLRPGCPIINL